MARALLGLVCGPPHGNGRSCPSVAICPIEREKRRFVLYLKGPLGWSHHPSDPIRVPPNKDLDFLGMREDIYRFGSLRRRVFVLQHELEHERQRFCDRSMRGGFWSILVLELRANLAAWRAMHRIARRWEPFAVRLGYSVALALGATMIVKLGDFGAQAMIFSGVAAISLGVYHLPNFVNDWVYWLTVLALLVPLVLTVIGFCVKRFS